MKNLTTSLIFFLLCMAPTTGQNMTASPYINQCTAYNLATSTISGSVPSLFSNLNNSTLNGQYLAATKTVGGETELVLLARFEEGAHEIFARADRILARFDDKDFAKFVQYLIDLNPATCFSLDDNAAIEATEICIEKLTPQLFRFQLRNQDLNMLAGSVAAVAMNPTILFQGLLPRAIPNLPPLFDFQISLELIVPQRLTGGAGRRVEHRNLRKKKDSTKVSKKETMERCDEIDRNCLCRLRALAPPYRSIGGIKIAIVDSGLLGEDSADSGFFSNVLWNLGRNTIGPDEPLKCDVSRDNCFDLEGHGTEVTSAVAEEHFGSAPGAGIIPVRSFLGDCADAGDLVQGVEEAINQMPHVIVLPWHFPAETKTESVDLEVLIRDHPEVLFVVPSGDGPTSEQAPDLKNVAPPKYSLPNLLVVGGTDNLDRWNSYFGPDIVHAAAPNSYCLARQNNGLQERRRGTSLAAGFAAGIAARIWARDLTQSISRREVVQEALFRSARKPPNLNGCCSSNRGDGPCGIVAVPYGTPAKVEPSKPKGSVCKD